MTPAAAIAWKDWREAAQDGRALLAWTLALLLLAVAAWQGWSARQQAADARAALSAQVRQQWDTQGDKNPHSGAHFGQYVFKPDSLGSFIDPGVNDEAGRTIWLDPHRRNLARLKAAEDASAASRLAQASVAAVLQWGLPLLVVLLGFAAVAGERESGTWRVLASLGVGPARLFAGKLAGLGLVMLPLLGFFAVVAALALLRGESADTLARLAGLAALYALYLVVFGCLALGVSARSSSASRALAVLLVLWGLNGFVAPRLGTAVADAAVTLPSTEQFHAAIREDIELGLPGDGTAQQRYERFLAETLERHGVARAEDLPVGVRGLRLLANDAYSSRVHALHFAKLERSFTAQADWQLSAALAGPLAPVRALSQALAGTDVRHHIHFAGAAEQYRRSFVDATSEEIARRNTGTGNGATVGDDYWRAVPPFDYRAPSWRDALAEQWRAALVLAAWLLAAFAFATSGFQRLAREP